MNEIDIHTNLTTPDAMSKKRNTFRIRNLYTVKKPPVLHVARQKLSFIIATFSLFAFVVGNMVGQHGWYAFWKTVLGAEDGAMIVFVGTVPPVEQVPDYTKWARYGGGAEDHPYRMVPKDVLVPLPLYDAATLRSRGGDSLMEAVYSVGNLGDYASGADHGGSHVGVDIRVPLGTPIVSIANGIVEKVSMQEYGYGHYVMIRHPNVPDPNAPGSTTTIRSVYAHMDQVLPVEGQIVHKGQTIGTSGQTGFASGPHLHFQIDRDDAPFHPYWPFTSAEASEVHLSFNQAINRGLHQERGEQYTISPLLFVQQYRDHTIQTIASVRGGTSGVASQTVTARTMTPAERITAAREKRMQERLARIGRTTPVTTVVLEETAPKVSETAESSAPPEVEILKTVSIETPAVSRPVGTVVDRLEIRHSGTLGRLWQKVSIVALDADGNTVKHPSFTGKAYVIAEFGDAEIRPNVLTDEDFREGVATVNILTRGGKTLILGTRGVFRSSSEPMMTSR